LLASPAEFVAGERAIILPRANSGRQARGEPVIVLQLHPVARKVVELLEPHIERQGFELVAVEFRKGTRSSLLRLLIDKPGGRIALDELERLSPTLSDLLDVYDPVEGRYTFELASPGINRPLSKLEHFRAHQGRRVKIRMRTARNGRKTFIGRLVEVSGEGILVDDEVSQQREAIGYDEMAGANYEHDFE
jgi:ribosome maturation factor RimP